MKILSCLIAAAMLAAAAPPDGTRGAEGDPVLNALHTELSRSYEKLKAHGPAPVHYLAYRLYDRQSISMSATYGGIEEQPDMQHSRALSVELRAGTSKLDSTHRHRGGRGFHIGRQDDRFPLDDDQTAMRTVLWNETDSAFKDAQKVLKEVQTNKDVMVAEEDQSDDFSAEKPQVFYEKDAQFNLDRPLWEARLKRLSAIYKRHPQITESSVELRANKTRRYLVSSEGTSIADNHVQYELFTVASATADDGMRVWLYDHAEAPTAAGLPDEKKLQGMIDKLAHEVELLRTAPTADPFAGPVILKSKSAGVFFHEVFGHRAEGHRQKDEEEARTFAKMIGKRIAPDFISVVDNPTLASLAGVPLNGFYRFDDEGVPAQKVVLIDHGILKTFLMNRSPIKAVSHSNGHGRCSPGGDPVARQGNLIVQSATHVPYAQLRKMLIAEAKRQGKPYGLVFDEIAGGFTFTTNWLPQVFKLEPLRVYRVYTDGRADELVRGVSIIGTPLVSLEKIMAAGDDLDVFNGNCGAESGWVPVSACSPSLLLQTLEIERPRKDQDKPPLLPPPANRSDT